MANSVQKVFKELVRDWRENVDLHLARNLCQIRLYCDRYLPVSFGLTRSARTKLRQILFLTTEQMTDCIYQI